MILPIGHESQTVRRIPWVTIAIVAICLLVHISLSGKNKEFMKELVTVGKKMVEYYVKRPYLELDPEVEKYLFPTEAQKQEFEEYMRIYGKEEPEESIVEFEQEELDALAAAFKQVMKKDVYRKWGHVPAENRPVTLITSMFVHIGWLHLIGNMLFLYLSAPFVEDAWGKPVFAAFFILSGIVSGLAQVAHYPNSMIPGVGASGAIAGVMGAFMIRFWNTRIRFVYFFSLLIRGTFKAPAWLMLPIWGLDQMLSGMAMDKIDPTGKYGGTGYWVHFWGFMFGLAVAAAIKYFNIEEKYIKPKIEADTNFVNENYKVYEQAMEILGEGGKEEAYGMLLAAVSRDPTYTDNVEALWNISLETGKKEEAAPYLQRLMETCIRRNQLEPALVYYKQLRTHIGEVNLSTMSKIPLLEQMVNKFEFEPAAELGREIVGEVNAGTPSGLLVSLCKSLVAIDRELKLDLAKPVVELVMANPDVPAFTKTELEEELSRQPSMLQSSSSGVSAGSGAGLAAVGMAGLQVEMSRASQPAQTPPPIPPTQSREVREISLSFDQQPPPIPDHAKGPGSQPPPVPTSMLRDGDEPVPSPPQPGGPVMRDGEIVLSLDDFQGSRGKSEEPVVTAQNPQSPQTLQPPSSPRQPESTTIRVERDIEESMAAFARKVLKPTYVVPLGVKEGRIALNVDKVGQRALPLQKIKVVSTVKITPPGQSAFLVIDLFLDDPKTHSAVDKQTSMINIRTLRVSSKTFNPQSIIPNTKSLSHAFQVFNAGVLKLSKAVPFPDLESVQLKKISTFSSIEDYETALLNAW
jgi:membrane associated rhomboid family serine protease